MNLVSLFFFIIFFSFSPVYSIVKVGVTAGPHAMIMEKVKQLLVGKGVEIDIIEFNDFVLPNEALNNDELDVNSMQHAPYLQDQCQSRGYDLIAVAKTVLMPFGIYSKKVKNLGELSEGGKVAIPNDPTNGGRALLLLEKIGLIELDKVPMPNILSVKSNPKGVVFVELEAPQLPRALDDVDIALINTDWVVLSNLDPQSALLTEDKESPYTNLLVVKKGNEGRKDIQELIKAYHSEEVKSYILKEFKGAILPAW